MPIQDRGGFYAVSRDGDYIYLRGDILSPLLGQGVRRMTPVFKDVESQDIELGALIDRNTMERIGDGATILVSVDGESPQAAAGVLTLGSGDVYSYSPALSEVSGDRITITLDHSDAIQPLVVDSVLISRIAWQNMLYMFANNEQLTAKTVGDLTTPKILEITTTAP